MSAALFSIITVTRDNLQGLQRTATSLKNQICNDFEWIIIDGASKDESVDFLEKTDANWVSKPDHGIYDAMNKGIERAQGLYLLFLNAGDTLFDHQTLSHLETAAQNQPAMIYGDSIENSHYKPAKDHTTLKRGLFTHHQAILYQRNTLGATRYNTAQTIAADYDFTARFLQKTADEGVLYCPFPLCHFESGGISQIKAALGRNEQFKIRKDLKLCTPPENIMIWSAQFLSWQFRRIAPDLYWRLKSSGNSAHGSSQNQIPQIRQ